MPRITTEVSWIDINLTNNRPPTDYKRVPGAVAPFNGYELPQYLRKGPLVQAPGDFPAFKSGDRSSVVNIDGRWFKKKGDAPVQGKPWPSGEPYGGMSKGHAENELKAAALINDRLQDFGYHGPLVPAALTEYAITFDGGNVCSAMLETFGDTRVSNINSRLYRANSTGLLMDRKFRMELTYTLAEWFGFCHRILRELRLFPEAEESYGPGNYAVYRLGNGFGVFRVDFSAYTSENSDVYSQLLADDLGMTTVHTYEAFRVSDESLERNGFTLESFARWNTKQMENDTREIALARLNGVKPKQMAEPPPLDKKAFEEIAEEASRIREHYQSALNGDVVPKPIQPELLHPIFAIDISHNPSIVEDITMWTMTKSFRAPPPEQARVLGEILRRAAR